MLARGTARVLGLHADEVRTVWRAGLLHDIGKLGVSNRIHDKPGKLDARERAEVERHPAYTWEILSRVEAFAEFALSAAAHHEKLDGSGYPWGLKDAQLDRASRILAVSDIYEAITADRPYRAGMCHDAAMAILEKDRGTKYDAAIVDALGVFVEGTRWTQEEG
jgi:HD-GYP domain-containing protein (c-di-GMP phosphodiesterase class II)